MCVCVGEWALRGSPVDMEETWIDTQKPASFTQHEPVCSPWRRVAYPFADLGKSNPPQTTRLKSKKMATDRTETGLGELKITGN